MATQTLEGAVQRYGGYTSAGNITGYHARVATDADGKLLGVIAEGAPAGAPAVGEETAESAGNAGEPCENP